MGDCSVWPLISPNKVEDPKVSEPVQRCTKSENLVLKKAAWDVRIISSSYLVIDLSFYASYSTNGEPDTEAPEGCESHRILIFPLIYSAQFRTPQQDPSNDWAPPPPPPPKERLPKHSKLDDLVEAECGIKSLGFAQTKQFNTAPYRCKTNGTSCKAWKCNRCASRGLSAQRSRRQWRKKCRKHVLEEAAAAAEEQSKEEQRNVERD
jgi:hypothetical protein